MTLMNLALLLPIQMFFNFVYIYNNMQEQHQGHTKPTNQQEPSATKQQNKPAVEQQPIQQNTTNSNKTGDRGKKQEDDHNNKNNDKQPSTEQKVQPKQQKPKDIEPKQNETQNLLELQLLDMGFELPLVKQALKMTTSKDKAIEYIIASLENEEKIQQMSKGQNKKNMMMAQGEQKDLGKKKQQGDDQDYQDFEQQYKMMFLVRMDLKMGLGKIAAQVAHATLKAYKQMVVRGNENDLDFVALEEWKEMGQKKIVVKVNDQNQLLSTLKKASEKGINTCYIRDAGLTQIASGSITVGALGPAPSSELDLLTKCFKLL